MGKDDDRARSLARAKDTGKGLLVMGLNAFIPGAGTAAEKLASHITNYVRDARLARLEDFNRRVFESDVSDAEKTARFKAMEDGDFQHLLVSMLTDIEAEKVPVYTAVYIHLVERDDMSKAYKRLWALAVAQLQLAHMRELVDVLGEERWWPSGACAHQLVSLRLAERDEHFVPGARNDRGEFLSPLERDQVIDSINPTDFGWEFATVIRPAMDEPA